MENLSNDEKSLIDFRKILPEDTMDKISIEIGYEDGKYKSWIFEVLEKYGNYAKKIFSQYDNKKIKEKFDVLNDVFKKLNNFIKAYLECKTVYVSHEDKFKGIVATGYQYQFIDSLDYDESIKKAQELNLCFQEFFNAYKDFLITAKQIISKKESTLNSFDQQFKLYLTLSGDLYMKPKEKFCYSMGEKDKRHKLVKFLAGRVGEYQPTKVITYESEYTSDAVTKGQIAKIRKNMEYYLDDIDGKELLEAKPGSGYRINPKYEIILKDD